MFEFKAAADGYRSHDAQKAKMQKYENEKNILTIIFIISLPSFAMHRIKIIGKVKQ